MLVFAGIQPVAIYATPIAWTCYILLADAAVLAMRGQSRLHDAPGQFADDGRALEFFPILFDIVLCALAFGPWVIGANMQRKVRVALQVEVPHRFI